MQNRNKGVFIDAPNNTSINQKVGFHKSGLFFKDKMHFNLCIFLNDFHSLVCTLTESNYWKVCEIIKYMKENFHSSVGYTLPRYDKYHFLINTRSEILTLMGL